MTVSTSPLAELPAVRERPAPPDGPCLVVGLGRAGLAAAEALQARSDPEAVRVWDAREAPWVVSGRAALERRGVHVQVGGDPVPLLDGTPGVRCVVKSPGVSGAHPVVAAARRRGLSVIDEAELGWRMDGRPLVGVTGTNGKSTTAALACAVLRSAGVAPLLAGNTHDGPPLSALGGAQGEVVVAELSSFQLEGCPALTPEVGVFTNLTHEHLDRHGTRAHYADCKRRLFVRGTRCVSQSIVNADDPFGRRLGTEVMERGGRRLSFGTRADADFRLEGCTWTLDSCTLSVRTPDGPLTFDTRLPGAHNAMNALAALAFAHALGVDLRAAVASLGVEPGVPGRLERVTTAAPFDVVVDYAHNPDGLRRVLETLRAVLEARPHGRLIAVASTLWFTDATQRRAMGAVAASLADHLVLTTERYSLDEDPGVPGALIEGARAAGEGRYEVVEDRRRAIVRALDLAGEGDVVAVLGRGALRFPILDEADCFEPFDDREVARELLAETVAEG